MYPRNIPRNATVSIHCTICVSSVRWEESEESIDTVCSKCNNAICLPCYKTFACHSVNMPCPICKHEYKRDMLREYTDTAKNEGRAEVHALLAEGEACVLRMIPQYLLSSCGRKRVRVYNREADDDYDDDNDTVEYITELPSRSSGRPTVPVQTFNIRDTSSSSYV
jgi:hypothetical protein